MSNSNKTKGKGKAVPNAYAPKVEPKLAGLARVVTANYAFRCLIDNPDVFQSEDYKNCAIVKECFGTNYADVLQDLQSRESGEQYWRHYDLEDAGMVLAATIDTPMKDGRKGAAMLRAMRPYLLLDKWITVMRKSPADKTLRPVLGPDDLPGFQTAAAKAGASKSNARSEGKTLNKHRAALHKSHSVTLKMLNFLTPSEDNRMQVSQVSAVPMTDEHVWNRLINYGVNSKRFTQLGTAQYRLATMAVVVNFFLQSTFSDRAITEKAEKMFTSAQKSPDELSSREEGKGMLTDGLQWLNMAVATTLKDTLVYPQKEVPSGPFLLEVGMRYRQCPEEPNFVQLENGLWELMFELALLKTEKSLAHHLLSIGEIADAERSSEHNRSVVLFPADPAGALPSKRQRDSSVPSDSSRPAKKARETGKDTDVMDIDAPSSSPADDQFAQYTCELCQDCYDSLHTIAKDVLNPRLDIPTTHLSDKVCDLPPESQDYFFWKRFVNKIDLFFDPDAEEPEPVIPPGPLTHGRLSRASSLGPDATEKNDTGGKSSNSVEEENAKTEDSRYPKRDRNPTQKALLSQHQESTANENDAAEENDVTDANKPAGETNVADETEGGEENDAAEEVEEEHQIADIEMGAYAGLTDEFGYKFVDTEREVTDVDAWYEAQSASNKKKDGATHVVKKTPSRKAHAESAYPELQSVPPPPNKQTVNINVGGEDLAIHTWYEGDFLQLSAFKKRFEEGGTCTAGATHATLLFDATPDLKLLRLPWSDTVANISAKDFKDLSAESLQDTLAEKHILVTGCDSITTTDDMERRLLMKRVIDIQGKMSPSSDRAFFSLTFIDLYSRNDTSIASHCHGTLQRMKDIMYSDDADDQQRPLNALDLPCGHIPIEIPRLADISFRDVVWSFLKNVDRPLYQETLPMDDFRWALYSSRNAYSTPHVDANGLCTAIAPVDCRKLWILGRPLKENLRDSRALAKFRMYDIDVNDYEWAPLLIKPGDILYMKPGTVHAVVTIDPGFTIGEHFYTMTTLEDSLSSLFHLCAANALLTNASHNVAVVKTLVRLLHCWRYRVYYEVEQAGVPMLDLCNPSHVRCLVMIGTYLHVFPYVEDLERGLSSMDVRQLEQADTDYCFLYNGLLQHFEVHGLDDAPYTFASDNHGLPKEGMMAAPIAKSWEEELYDVIFRNGEMWIIAHLVKFFANASELVGDAEEKEKIDAHARRLQKLIPTILHKVHLTQHWFDDLQKWVNTRFDILVLDGWLNWDGISIERRGKASEASKGSKSTKGSKGSKGNKGSKGSKGRKGRKG